MRSRPALLRGLAGRLLGLLAAGALSSCARRPPDPPPRPLDAAEVSRLLVETRAAAAGVRRFQAVFGVRGERDGRRTSGRLLVVFARPEADSPPADESGPPPGGGAVEAMRISAFGPVGGARWSLVARPGRVEAVAPGERVFAVGAALREFTEPLFGVAVGLEEVGAALAGSGVPIPAGAEGVPAEDGARLAGGGGSLRWAPVPVGAAHEGSDSSSPRVIRAAAPGYEVRYPDRADSGRQVPRRIEIGAPGVEATLRVEELRINARLHPDSFRLPDTAGLRRLSVPAFLEAVQPRAR